MSSAKPSKRVSKYARKTPAVRCKLNPTHDPYQTLIAIYLLRLVIGLRDTVDIANIEDLFTSTDYTKLTGLSTDAVSYPDDMEIDELEESYRQSKERKSRIYKAIRNQIKKLLAQELPQNAPLYTNLDQLAAGLGLSACDQEILILSLFLFGGNNVISNFIDMYAESNTSKDIVEYLHIMTTRPKAEITKSLAPSSPLCRMGWLDASHAPNVCSLITTPSLAGILFQELEPDCDLQQLFLKPLKTSRLTIDAYPDQKNDLEVLIPTLKAAIAQQKPGINILLYGPSGISKRELAKLLAKSIDTRLYEVPDHWQEQSFLNPEDRFSACKTIQCWLVEQQQPALMLIDEAEEILPHRRNTGLFDDEDSYEGINLGRVQQQLSTNPLPIIWIIDKPKKLDIVCLRQFTYSLEIESMPEALRARCIGKAIRNLGVSRRWRQQLLQRQDLSIKQIEKAADMARLNVGETDLSAEIIMERVLNSHTHLFRRPALATQFTCVTGYDLRYTNTSTPLHDLVSGLQRHSQANLCFYGAPGTGKTAFAKYLANQLGLPILIKRASDLLDKYVGENEKNVASMFIEAKYKRAILLLDEADSFFSDRRDSSQNWEISKVNEMLTHMEAFDGIFIATTNLMERMDAASLRRFDFKVKFDYLTADQRWNLFLQESKRLGVTLPVEPDALESLHQKLQRLTKLTPGDFAVLVKQARFQAQALSPDNMLHVLQQECLAKGETFAKIGFVH